MYCSCYAGKIDSPPFDVNICLGRFGMGMCCNDTDYCNHRFMNATPKAVVAPATERGLSSTLLIDGLID